MATRSHEDPADRRRVTLVQVAERAGVSRSAASFVLSGRTDQRISAETFARVRQAAAELGYTPNITARTLRTGRSGAVALVSDFVSSTSFANGMIRGALQLLGERDMLLFTVETQGDSRMELALVQNLLDRQVDGVIYASMFTRAVTVPALLRAVPLVLLNCVSEGGDPVVSVVPDEQAAGLSAIRVLLEAGHRDGIHFVGDFPPGTTGGASWRGWHPLALPQRLAGVRAGLAAVGAELAGVSHIVDWDVASGHRAVAELLRGRPAPTAIVCINDAVGAGAYRAVREAGLDVPQDVSIVAFDGSTLAGALDPPLASVALPQEELGRTAARLLLDGAAGAPEVHRVPMPLLGSASVAPPR
ncbi:MAG: LacI family DNA-binding transcriptional regulator [Actinobacteria bacterium]|nr:LacI family DNA-binding transcriptional regulator [Actinomycetota bacterium]MCG2797450.1 LacI family DNA-binding transcriptional regulator [Cellulomonas sp.]